MLAKIRRMRFRDKVSLREITRTHLVMTPTPFISFYSPFICPVLGDNAADCSRTIGGKHGKMH